MSLVEKLMGKQKPAGDLVKLSNKEVDPKIEDITPWAGHFWATHPDQPNIESPPFNVSWPSDVAQTSKKHLWLLRKCAIIIRNSVPKNEEAYKRWHAHYVEWCARFAQSAPVQDEDLFYWVEILNEAERCPIADSGKPTWNKTHAIACRTFSEQIRRLEYWLRTGGIA